MADVCERGSDMSLSGRPFTSLHGDFVTEIFNGQTNITASPHSAGFSTDVNKVNDCA